MKQWSPYKEFFMMELYLCRLAHKRFSVLPFSLTKSLYSEKGPSHIFIPKFMAIYRCGIHRYSDTFYLSIYKQLLAKSSLPKVRVKTKVRLPTPLEALLQKIQEQKNIKETKKPQKKEVKKTLAFVPPLPPKPEPKKKKPKDLIYPPYKRSLNDQHLPEEFETPNYAIALGTPHYSDILRSYGPEGVALLYKLTEKRKQEEQWDNEPPRRAFKTTRDPLSEEVKKPGYRYRYGKNSKNPWAVPPDDFGLESLNWLGKGHYINGRKNEMPPLDGHIPSDDLGLECLNWMGPGYYLNNKNKPLPKKNLKKERDLDTPEYALYLGTPHFAEVLRSCPEGEALLLKLKKNDQSSHEEISWESFSNFNNKINTTSRSQKKKMSSQDVLRRQGSWALQLWRCLQGEKAQTMPPPLIGKAYRLMRLIPLRVFASDT
jgi:hypothetical protein